MTSILDLYNLNNDEAEFSNDCTDYDFVRGFVLDLNGHGYNRGDALVATREFCGFVSDDVRLSIINEVYG